MTDAISRLQGEHQPLPHEQVYVRLGVSKIHGVGVFAIRAIPRGANIFANDQTEMIWIDPGELRARHLSAEIMKLYEDFAVARGERLGVPRNFNELTTGWYLNEPLDGVEPNVGMGEGFNFIALRDIGPGEELLTDYSLFSEPIEERPR